MIGDTLLVVDDDRLWRNSTAGYFSHYFDYKIYTAASCAEAISLAAQVRPDYVLLDYHLKDGSAVEVAGAIRADQATQKALILVVSADETMRDTAYAECQADHFILKPAQYASIEKVMRGLRRRVCLDCGIVENGDIRLETLTSRVFKDSKPLLTLSPERFRLFTLLLTRAPAVVSEEEILNHFYAPAVAQEKRNCVKVLLHRLRQDLGPLADRIQNQRGEGWSYIPPRTVSAP
jgi:two-component system phosphate regulon response regulator PhoB